MATVLVIGASRGIGLETIKAGLAAGHDMRALARSASSIPLNDARLTKISGNALSRSDVEGALTGAAAVIQALGVSSPGEILFGTTLFSASTSVLIEAMAAKGVRRLIAVTGAGAGNSRGRIGPLYDHIVFPIVLQRIYADKDIAEDMITRSGLDWTIVRPTGLTNGPRTGTYQVLPELKDWRGGFISRANVADFLIKQVSDTSLIGKTPLLTG